MRSIRWVAAAVVVTAFTACSDGDSDSAGPVANFDSPENRATTDAPDDEGGVMALLDEFGPEGDPAGEPPAVGIDHWHSGYEVRVCGERQLPYPDDSASDVTGIHSHGDGLIHIHPFQHDVAGGGALLGVFFDEIEIAFDDSTLELSSGEVLREGEVLCDGAEAELRVVRWPDLDGHQPEMFTEGLRGVGLTANGQLFSIVWVGPNTRVDEIAPPDAAFLREYLALP